jgi:hypothetical protein
MSNIKHVIGFVLLFSLVVLSGCSLNSKSTPKGEFKKFDLRKTLPAEIAAISDSQTQEHSKEISIGEPAVKALLKWRTFKKENSSYTLSVSIEVLQEMQGVQLTNATIQDPINTGGVDSVVQANVVTIIWDSSKLGSTVAGTFIGTITSKGEFLSM